jgi:AcrR family transcriptional regulator
MKGDDFVENLSTRSQRKVTSIVEQASRLFVRYGFHKVTMESIAQYANVSKVTLYKYFADKMALYEYIILEQLKNELFITKDIVTDIIPYHEKWARLIYHVMENHQAPDYVIFENELLLSLGATKQLNDYNKKLQKLRFKLYNQGRMEEYIDDTTSDSMLESLYNVISSGLISQYSTIQSLPEDEQHYLIKLLLDGITKSH